MTPTNGLLVPLDRLAEVLYGLDEEGKPKRQFGVNTAYKLIEEGKLAAVQLAGKTCIRMSDLQAFVDALEEHKPSDSPAAKVRAQMRGRGLKHAATH